MRRTRNCRSVAICLKLFDAMNRILASALQEYGRRCLIEKVRTAGEGGFWLAWVWRNYGRIEINRQLDTLEQICLATNTTEHRPTDMCNVHASSDVYAIREWKQSRAPNGNCIGCSVNFSGRFISNVFCESCSLRHISKIDATSFSPHSQFIQHSC